METIASGMSCRTRPRSILLLLLLLLLCTRRVIIKLAGGFRERTPAAEAVEVKSGSGNEINI